MVRILPIFGSSVKRKRGGISEMEKIAEPKVQLKRLCRNLLHQVPGESLKLKQLKVLIDEHSYFCFFQLLFKERCSCFLEKKAGRQ
ncbi:hypothetical protein L1049_006476 [Liquidambar formosana]|uniref:Cell growth-regulating nucleolar protein-like winged helix domain-containing protein n=1 Tax=Liquidambar formosana TaxID=63359 RepID=A0AAP0WU61_LIQFO